MKTLKIVLLFTLLTVFYAQNCPHLCANDCRSVNATACTSCYNNFYASSTVNSTCTCPVNFYKFY